VTHLSKPFLAGSGRGSGQSLPSDASSALHSSLAACGVGGSSHRLCLSSALSSSLRVGYADLCMMEEKVEGDVDGEEIGIVANLQQRFAKDHIYVSLVDSCKVNCASDTFKLRLSFVQIAKEKVVKLD
jgi:hypothetical protein